MVIESARRIEPARVEDAPVELANVIAELSAKSAVLESALDARTAASLAHMVRVMNTYYSNLIEGHFTRPRDIERALTEPTGRTDEIPRAPPIGVGEGADAAARSLLTEAVAHVRVQEEIDRLYAARQLPEPASPDFLMWLHREFYRGASEDMLKIRGAGKEFLMAPGAWRSEPRHDVRVGRHQPPSSDRVSDIMAHFAARYRLQDLGKAARILAIPAAHHRFNYIHPFPDGNGRVSRLMSHAMAHVAGVGAHGLWSVSRGLARGLKDRSEYKMMMDRTDQERQGDLDGRGNLSERALVEFCLWFLRVCLDQVEFMSGLFDIGALAARLRAYVERSGTLRVESARLLEEALVRGAFDRGDIARITGLPERTARRALNDAIAEGLLASDTPRGPMSLRFPAKAEDILFPRLFWNRDGL